APLLPLPGGGTQAVQPLHVDDLAEAIVRLATGEAPPSTLDAVGPRPLPMREYLQALAGPDARPLRVVRLPTALLAPLLPLASRLTGGLVGPDALRMPEAGNPARAEAITRLLGRPPRGPAPSAAAHDRA